MSAMTAHPSAPTGWARRRWLTALLIISVALNLFFMAGAAWTQLHRPAAMSGFEPHYEQMAARLKLDPQQKIGFHKYVAAMRARTDKMREQVEPVISAAWGEIAKPHADVSQVMQLFDDASEKRRAFQREAAVQTLDFLSILSPAQRDAFVQIARERRAAWIRAHQEAH
jgi:Spy/CpxP family protein refolding chaperone